MIMKNRDKAIRKAKELVGKMTIEERASQLTYNSPAIKRLGIPAYNWWNEGLHGVARAGTATSFPQAIALAATFDEDLLHEIADVIAEEGRAKYNAYTSENDRGIYKGLTFWSPNVNIFRDPRWGRGHETYGEDPFLSGRLGVAFIKGLQGDGEVMKSAACAKHFAVHSGPEDLRHEFDAIVSDKDLYETYLPAFEACVKEGQVEAVMGAYNRTNGEPCCGSYTLLRDILRDAWEFEGHIVSDCGAIQDFHTNHMVTATAEDSVALALDAGCDLNCGNMYLYTLKALQSGKITEEHITASAERLMTTRILLGLFEGSEYDNISYDVIECQEHQELAMRAAANGTVLLKNDGVLPLSKSKVKTIGVIGPNANSRDALRGNYYGTSSRYTTVLEGIQDYLGESARVFYSEGCHLYKEKVEALGERQDRIAEAVFVAKNSDVVVLCVGLDEELEGEESDANNQVGSGDKKDLKLPEVQIELIEKVIEAGKPTVVILMAGSAIDLSYADEHANAVLQAWYPGAGGGEAIAKLLFGETSPSGKLPITFYRGLAGMPEFTDYSMTGRTYRYLDKEPLYPFGYGLTYGKAIVTDAKIVGTVEKDKPIEIEVTIANKSDIKVDEVIQIYIKDMDSALAVKNHSLCAFKRVSLHERESKNITMTVDAGALSIVNEDGKRQIVSSRFVLYVGTSQPDSRSVSLLKEKPIEIEIVL